MVDWDWVRGELAAATDYWVATTRPNGHPHAAPIWGVFIDEELYLETSPQTLKARNIGRDPRAVVHIGGGSAVVIVECRVHPFVPDQGTAARVAERMADKYPGYEPGPHDWDGGGLFRVLPSKVLAWREMNTATRFNFGR
jgi:nitroimidazol reductase NimA-like FMN-containing flavoprotein (pyridoxamine 5'-phosphate oxidase superfamily)